MYRTIVFGTDGSPTANIARDVAIDLAARYEAKIVAVTAFEPARVSPDAAQAVAQQAVDAAAAKFVAGIAMIQRGEPADVVLEVADRERADLIVVGNKGMGEARRFRLGSVPDRVAHYAPSDVLIVATTRIDPKRAGAPRSYKRILAASDGSPTANDAVRTAFELGVLHNSVVTLVHVGDPILGTIRLESVARARPEHMDVQLRTVEGDPAEQICDLAERGDSDLIVVGNKGMAGARRYLLGSVPNRVAHSAPTDVLIVRTVDISVMDIEPDQGAVVDLEGKRMAVYRDAAGEVHSVSARCTHLGCTVGWNEGDKTWDCPCHGSRYDRFGHVVRGPAKMDLEGSPPRADEQRPIATPATEAVTASAAQAQPRPTGRTRETFLIVGASVAGGSAAAKLRQEGFDGKLVLIGAENHYPYERPPLSKAFLRGETAFEEQLVRPVGFYRDHDIEVRFATRATELDPSAQTVTLETGERIRFDRCLIATGARNRRLPIPGLDLPGVYGLRTVSDAERIREQIEPGRRVVLAGMGFIGSEVAASLRQAGLQVATVDGGKVPLARVLGEELGAVLAEVHRENGVELHPEDGVAAFEGDGWVRTVVTRNGVRLECDFAVVGLGVEPNVELALDGGLTVDNGIVVDQFCRTSAENVYAAGDVANHFHPVFDQHIRTEHWQNALSQGEAAAVNMLGRDVPYQEIPWFWSDQFDQNLQYTGFHMDWDDLVIRGRLEDRRFVAFFLTGGRVQSALAMNEGQAIPQATSLIASRSPVERSALADEDVELRTLAPAAP